VQQRPKCDNPKCENGALIFYGVKKLCGDCCMKLESVKQRAYDQLLEEANEELAK